ncbi:MAG: hypothetical protein A2V84_01555 [Chloroflexi bacterium RBG_16_70_13]|nr:MAG: hypothetical protein A2V84_01555 [Chloroflexi bacterium RBG_16_70_13]
MLEGEVPLHREGPGKGEARSGVGEDHRAIDAGRTKTGRLQARGEIDGLVGERQGPDVRQPVEGREEGDDLVEPALERPRVAGPGGGGDPIPERLRVRRVVEEEGVAELAGLPGRDRVDGHLVTGQAAREGLARDNRFEHVGVRCDRR